MSTSAKRSSVSVPVLSSSTRSTLAKRSTASPERTITPRSASRFSADQITTGVASPITHGHATNSTDIALNSPTSHPATNIQ